VEALEGSADLTVGGQAIRNVKNADDLVLLAKEETVLQGMVDRLIENWKTLWNGDECGRN
jgi:hypothetical protein